MSVLRRDLRSRTFELRDTNEDPSNSLTSLKTKSNSSTKGWTFLNGDQIVSVISCDKVSSDLDDWQTRALPSMRNLTGSQIPLITRSKAMVKKTRAPRHRSSIAVLQRQFDLEELNLCSFLRSDEPNSWSFSPSDSRSLELCNDCHRICSSFPVSVEQDKDVETTDKRRLVARTRSSSCISLAGTFRPWASRRPKHLQVRSRQRKEKFSLPTSFIESTNRSMLRETPRVCCNWTEINFGKSLQKRKTFFSGLERDDHRNERNDSFPRHSTVGLPRHRIERLIAFAVDRLFFYVDLSAKSNETIELGRLCRWRERRRLL